jgi:hypothetical protein
LHLIFELYQKLSVINFGVEFRPCQNLNIKLYIGPTLEFYFPKIE